LHSKNQFIYLFKIKIMNSKVIVTADATTNAVINVSENNPEWAYIRLEQVRTMIDDNGFLKRKPVSAIVPGLLTDLQASGFFAGQEIDGKIVVQESLEPFNKKNPERDLKIAGETGIVCTLGGLPIYRRTIFSFNGNGTDELIKHDNVEQLRAAYAATNKTNSSAITAAANDFNI
jgi:hypothetical protein